MTAHDPRVTLTEVLAAHVRLPMMHSQGCSCGWHASLSHPDLHRAHLAERIEEHIAARLAAIRALADEWSAPESHRAGAYVRERDAADRIRAALDATGADLSASQDHDGAEGRGEGERPGEALREAAAWIAESIGYPVETKMPDHPMPEALWQALVDHVHADREGKWHGNELDREDTASWLAEEAGR